MKRLKPMYGHYLSNNSFEWDPVSGYACTPSIPTLDAFEKEKK